MKYSYLLIFLFTCLSANLYALERPNPGFDIKDPALKRCILDHVDSNQPSKADLIVIKNLKCYDKRSNFESISIQSLEGLEGWTQLKLIEFYATPKANITALSSLYNLETISIQGDPREKQFMDEPPFDYSAILGLPNIKTLILSGLRLQNVDDLVVFKKLNHLLVDNNKITDINFIGEFKQLFQFSASDNEIRDIEIIASLDIQHINLMDNNIKEIPRFKKGTKAPLHFQSANFTNNPNFNCPYTVKKGEYKNCKVTYYPFFNFVDKHLLECVKDHIEEENIFDISLEDYNQLTELNCTGRGITSLEGLNNWGQLKKIDFSDNQIKDLSPLKSLVGLKTINFRLNNIEDLSVLNDILSIDEAFFEYNNISSLDSIIDTRKSYYSKRHRSIYLSDNDLVVCEPYQAIIFEKSYCE